MKAQILLVVILFLSISLAGQSFEQKELGEEVRDKGVVVYDTTVVNDLKLQVIHDRVFGKYGLYATLEQVVSEEKAQNGEVLYIEHIQGFLQQLEANYNSLLTNFLKVDTINVNREEVEAKITELEAWVNRVSNDPEIKNETTLSSWESKVNELQKLNSYQKQLQKKDKK